MPNYITAYAETNRVPTPDGWKLLGDLNPGDRLFNPDGLPVAITSVNAVHTLGMEVTMSDNRKYICSEYAKLDDAGHHIYDAFDQFRPYGKTKRKPIIYYRPIAQQVGYTKHDLPISPYIVGILCCEQIKIRGTYFILPKLTHTTIDQIRRTCQESEIPTARLEDATAINLTSKSQKVQDLMRKYDDDAYNLTQYIHDHYLTSCLKDRRELLSGIINITGRRTKSSCQLKGLSKTMRMCVLELLYSLGIPAEETAHGILNVFSNNLPSKTTRIHNKTKTIQAPPHTNQIGIKDIRHKGYVKSVQITLQEPETWFLIENYIPVLA